MYERALREVNDVLENMDEKYTKKISAEFINMMIKNMDLSYDFKYDITKSLEEQNLSEEAKTILSIIYLRYFCDENEKIDIIKQMKENDLEFENISKEKYNPDKIFDKKSNIKIETELPQIPKKWYQKIFEKLKKLLKK